MRTQMRVPLLVALTLSTVLTGALGRIAPMARAQTPTGYVTISSSGSLSQINVGVDTTLQVVDRRVSAAGEFFPVGITCTGDFGVFVTVGSTIYGPGPAAPWHCAGSRFNPPNVIYTPVSQTVSGNGTSSSPYVVVTVVSLTTYLTLTQTITFVAGQTYFTETNTLNNSSGLPVSAKIFNVAEPDPGSVDTAFGYHDPATGSVGADNPVGTTNPSGMPVMTPYVYSCTLLSAIPSSDRYYVYFAKVTGWQHSVVDNYQKVYNQVSASSTPPGHLSDTYNTACDSMTALDPAVAVEWDVTVGASSSVSVSKNVVFTSTLTLSQPGRVQGKVTCNNISPAQGITCSRIPIGNACPACGSSLNFFIPVTCAGAALDLLNIPCQGSVTGHLGLPNFTMAVKSGHIAIGPGFSGTVTLFGQGLYGGAGASFTLVGRDDDMFGIDTIQLYINGFRGLTIYTWTCRGMGQCIEIMPF